MSSNHYLLYDPFKHSYNPLPTKTVKVITQLIITVSIYISINNGFIHVYINELVLWLKIQSLVLNMFGNISFSPFTSEKYGEKRTL